MNKRIHVVINPASGQPEPILHTLNQVFHPAGVDWDVSISKEYGGGMKLILTGMAAISLIREVRTVSIGGG